MFIRLSLPMERDEDDGLRFGLCLFKESAMPTIRFLNFFSACILWSSATTVFAQPLRGDVVQNVAQLSTSASIDVQQDLLSISLNTTQSGADAATVQTQLKQALDAALTQAKQAQQGLPAGQMEVRTGNFSLYPRYGKDNRINGWQGSTELVLEGRDFPRITATAGKIQTLSLGNVSFGLSREQRPRVENEAQALAIERFKGKALEIAKSFGFSGYGLREVAVSASDQGYIPRPRAMTMQARADSAESPIPVEAGKSTVTINVSGSIQMR